MLCIHFSSNLTYVKEKITDISKKSDSHMNETINFIKGLIILQNTKYNWLHAKLKPLDK